MECGMFLPVCMHVPAAALEVAAVFAMLCAVIGPLPAVAAAAVMYSAGFVEVGSSRIHHHEPCIATIHVSKRGHHYILHAFTHYRCTGKFRGSSLSAQLPCVMRLWPPWMTAWLRHVKPFWEHWRSRCWGWSHCS